VDKLVKKLRDYCARTGRCRVSVQSDFSVVVFDAVVGAYVCFVFSEPADVTLDEITDVYLDTLLKTPGWREVKVSV